VVDELLPESAALVGVLDALLVADAREADRLDVMYVVPLDQTPWQSMRRVLTPPKLRSMSRTEMPFMPLSLVRTAVVK
jgi:hypothetical protein